MPLVGFFCNLFRLCWPYTPATDGKNGGLAIGFSTSNSALDVHCAGEVDQDRNAAHPTERDEMTPVWFGVVQQFDWQGTLTRLDGSGSKLRV